MAKRRVPAGLRGTVTTGRGGVTSKPLCGAQPDWIKGDATHVAPRLLCTRRFGHKTKTHQDSRGHEWPVVGDPRRSVR